MSSLNRIKPKIMQDELRRLMSEKKRNTLLSIEKKIDSPFAKYRDDGKLMCMLCNTVHSEKVWKVHVNGKQHRDRIVIQKKLETTPLVPNIPTKRRPPDQDIVNSPKKIKGILKNAPRPPVPVGFFDSDKPKVPEIKNEVNVEDSEPMEIDSSVKDSAENFTINNNDPDAEDGGESDEKQKPSSDIPEGFFDDPVLDAKARHIEYKDPIQEEWERFQKEIKEENTVSAQIIEDDQEEAIAERQIDEIDEQLRNWSRVLDLEVKKEKVQSETIKTKEEMEKDNSSEEEGDFDEFLDWRAKRSFR